MSRIATVKAYCADRHRLTAPRIVGGIENLRAILIHNAEDASKIVREGNIMSHPVVISDNNSHVSIIPRITNT